VKKDYTTTLDEVLKKYKENHEHQASFINSKCHFIENFREYFGKDTRLENIKHVELETAREYDSRYKGLLSVSFEAVSRESITTTEIYLHSTGDLERAAIAVFERARQNSRTQ
jgi:hypothetical protein